MANLFWGVSDALDLYGEYVEAKQQMAAKLQEARENAGQDVVVPMRKENAPIISFNSQPPTIDSEDEEDANAKNAEENQIPESPPIESVEKDLNDGKNFKESEDDGEKPSASLDSENKSASSKAKGDSELTQDSKHPSDASENQNEIKCDENKKEEIGEKDSKTDELLDGEKLCDTQKGERLETGEDPKPLDDKEGKSECEEKEKPPPPLNTKYPQETLNILIFGAGDPRHIIKTMAKRYTHCQNEGTASRAPLLKFYVVEGSMEIVARNMLLLGIALEKPDQLSLRNKVHLFMDIYGNSLLRPTSNQYMISKSTTLLEMASDRETRRELAPFIYLESLKYREIDALRDAFEFWQPKPGYDFKIKDYWLARLRRLLAVRYDTREGVFDWDLNMSLKDRGCEQICSQEYRYWRETGIAFTFPEYEQCKPNKTLAAGLTRNGGNYLHPGYVGDIQTGPFCTFGLRSVEERMHNSAHGQNDYRATDVTERNLLEYFHELQSGTPYEHNKELFPKYGGVRFQMGERLIHNEADAKNIGAYDQPWIKVEGIEVHFLPLEDITQVGKGAANWQNFFHVAFVGYKYFEFLTDAFSKVMLKESLIIFETKLRSVEIKNRIQEFETELLEYARCAHFTGVLNYSALNSKNSILKFWKYRSAAAK